MRIDGESVPMFIGITDSIAKRVGEAYQMSYDRLCLQHASLYLEMYNSLLSEEAFLYICKRILQMISLFRKMMAK